MGGFDLDYLVSICMATADKAGAPCSPPAREWAQVQSALSSAASSLETQTLDALMKLAERAVASDIPNTPELGAVQMRVTTLTESALDDIANATEEPAIVDVLKATEDAKAAGVWSVTLSIVENTAQSKAIEAVRDAVEAVSKDRGSVNSVNAAFENAVRAGIAEDVLDAERKSLAAEIIGRVAQAVSDVEYVGWKVFNIERLANALFLWRKLRVPATELQSGIAKDGSQVFARSLEKGFQSQDISSTVFACQVAGKAGATCPQPVRTWVTAVREVEEAAANLASLSPTAAIALAQKASQAGVPASLPGFAALSSAAQDAAAFELRSSLQRSEL